MTDRNEPVRSVVPRQLACDPCRRRKVRCDKLSPCSNCKSSSIPCESVSEPLPKRQRRQKTSLEQSIVELKDKVELLSQNLRSNTDNASPQSHFSDQVISTSPISGHEISSNDPNSTRDKEVSSDFEGESSFFTHSRQATQAFQASLASNPSLQVDEALAGAIEKLQGVLNRSAPGISTAAQTTQSLHESDYRILSALPMPPGDLVIRLLRYAKGQLYGYVIDFPVISLDAMTEYCQKMYFATENYTLATFIIVNSCLLYLLRDLTGDARAKLQISPAQRQHYLSVLPKNVDTAVREYKITSPPTLDNIKAIILAASLATESLISASAWDLMSVATRMALSAGLHRAIKGPNNPEKKNKRLLFWHIYSMDRSLALNMGRAPSIQDYDIDTEKLTFPDDIDRPMGYMYVRWVEVSEIQGEIYLQLYSAQAERQSLKTKIDSARKLAQRCTELQESLTMATTEFGEADTYFNFTLQGLGIVFGSLLTMIYRIIPPTDNSHPLQFSNECVQNARIALSLHKKALQCFAAESNDDWRTFLHWITLFSPFFPYIAVFGNVIAQRDSEDLALLETFVSSLKSTAETSSAVQKLLHVCSNFYQIAKIYITRHAQPVTDLGDTEHNVTANHQSLKDRAETDAEALPDFSLSQQDWDSMLDEWNLGLGTNDARQMYSSLDMFTSTGGYGEPE